MEMGWIRTGNMAYGINEETEKKVLGRVGNIENGRADSKGRGREAREGSSITDDDLDNMNGHATP